VTEHGNSDTKYLLSLALSSKGGEGTVNAGMYRDFGAAVLAELAAKMLKKLKRGQKHRTSD
jgi:hypothetical protein